MATRLQPVPGVLVGTGAGGIKYRDRDDVTVFAFERPIPTAATFTRNRFAAAPVAVAKQHLRSGTSQAWLINSGNANCGTGQRGLTVASQSCAQLAATLHAPANRVLPFSTGVIMEQLSPTRLRAGSDKAARALQPNNWHAAARAIMTTDTCAKGASRQVKVKGGKLTVTGIAKGSGMIHPNMATMLAFIATDATVPRSWLSTCLRGAVAETFNSISVDGDTSTNDAVVLGATSAAGKQSAAELRQLTTAITEVCAQLATAIVADGEGATTTACVTVTGLATNRACQAMADAVAGSPLIKTMLYARDPNIGRLLMAIGKAPVRFDPAVVTISFNGKAAFRRGQRVTGFTEALAKRQMKAKQVAIGITAGKTKTSAQRLFCDLGPDYIKINAEYRS